MIHISDPLEAHLPERGIFSITNGKQKKVISTFDKNLCQQHEQSFHAHCEYLKRFANQLQCNCHFLSTQDTIAESIQSRFAKRRGG